MAGSDMHMQVYNQRSKAIPVQARTSPEASRSLRLLEYLDNQQTEVARCITR